MNSFCKVFDERVGNNTVLAFRTVDKAARLLVRRIYFGSDDERADACGEVLDTAPDLCVGSRIALAVDSEGRARRLCAHQSKSMKTQNDGALGWARFCLFVDSCVDSKSTLG